jgi:hypothetical protein
MLQSYLLPHNERIQPRPPTAKRAVGVGCKDLLGTQLLLN